MPAGVLPVRADELAHGRTRPRLSDAAQQRSAGSSRLRGFFAAPAAQPCPRLPLVTLRRVWVALCTLQPTSLGGTDGEYEETGTVTETERRDAPDTHSTLLVDSKLTARPSLLFSLGRSNN